MHSSTRIKCVTSTHTMSYTLILMRFNTVESGYRMGRYFRGILNFVVFAVTLHFTEFLTFEKINSLLILVHAH